MGDKWIYDKKGKYITCKSKTRETQSCTVSNTSNRNLRDNTIMYNSSESNGLRSMIKSLSNENSRLSTDNANLKIIIREITNQKTNNVCHTCKNNDQRKETKILVEEEIVIKPVVKLRGRKKLIVSDEDGSDFKTLQDALNSIDNESRDPVKIIMKTSSLEDIETRVKNVDIVCYNTCYVKSIKITIGNNKMMVRIRNMSILEGITVNQSITEKDITIRDSVILDTCELRELLFINLTILSVLIVASYNLTTALDTSDKLTTHPSVVIWQSLNITSLSLDLDLY